VIKGLIRENKPIPVVEGIQSVPPKNVGPKKRKDIRFGIIFQFLFILFYNFQSLTTY